MTKEEIDKRRELVGYLKKGTQILASLKKEKVVDFTRYKRNNDAMRRLQAKLDLKGTGNGKS